jgi:translation initiation factor 4G
MLGSRSSSGRKGGLGPLSRGAEDSGASSRTNTPPVKDKESTASANQYRYTSLRRNKNSGKAHNHYSALAGLDASGEGADDVASPPSAASSPPVVKSHPAIASATAIENDRNPGTTASS